MDVVTFRIGPTDRHVEAFDICGGCGGGNPSVTWNNITNFSTIGQPGTARWVQPSPVGGGSSSGGGSNPPSAPPSPAPPDLTPILNAIAALKADLATLTAKVDAVAGVSVEARDAAKSAEIDSRDVNKARMDGWPAAGGTVTVPCLVGSVPRAFGGSSTVTFCPKE